MAEAGIDRRRVMRVMLAGLVLPWLAASRASGATRTGFHPPATALAFTRSLTRALADGAKIVATRRFAIRFRPLATGFEVIGSQTGSHVAAPPSLAEFARLEEQRVETGLFPVRLDRMGLILAREERLSDTGHDALNRAIGLAAGRLDAAPLDLADERAMRQFLRVIGQVGPARRTAMPAELFAPPAAPVEALVPVELPDGERGELRTYFAGTADPRDGLMRDAVRRVETWLGESRRVTLENWSLRPLGGS